VRAVTRLCEFYPGICLTTEEKARKNLSQGKKKPQSGYSIHITKHPYITKSTHTHTHIHAQHTHTYVPTHTHARRYTHTLLGCNVIYTYSNLRTFRGNPYLYHRSGFPKTYTSLTRRRSLRPQTTPLRARARPHTHTHTHTPTCEPQTSYSQNKYSYSKAIIQYPNTITNKTWNVGINVVLRRGRVAVEKQ